MGLELVEIVIESEEARNKLLDLYPLLHVSNEFLESSDGEHLLLQVFESTLEKVRHIFLKEGFVGCSGRSLLW
jgi:hypothetical protein